VNKLLIAIWGHCFAVAVGGEKYILPNCIERPIIERTYQTNKTTNQTNKTTAQKKRK